MSIYLQLQNSNGPWFDVCRPNNSNIPFFSTIKEYNERKLPELPVGSHPDRQWPLLVEPGIQSMEVYEAILAKRMALPEQLRHPPERPPPSPPLEKYVCQSGVIQIWPRRQPYAPASAADDRRLREQRDVCFTLVTITERQQIACWLEDREILTFPCPKIATPYGYVDHLVPSHETRVRARNACRKLGFGIGGGYEHDADGSQYYPRSTLPPCMITTANKTVNEWCLPSADGIARDGRATDDCGIQRIEWPTD